MKRMELCGVLLALLPPGVQVGAADTDLTVGKLAETRGLAASAHAVEGGAAHADLFEDFMELEHLRAGHSADSSSRAFRGIRNSRHAATLQVSGGNLLRMPVVLRIGAAARGGSAAPEGHGASADHAQRARVGFRERVAVSGEGFRQGFRSEAV